MRKKDFEHKMNELSEIVVLEVDRMISKIKKVEGFELIYERESKFLIEIAIESLTNKLNALELASIDSVDNIATDEFKSIVSDNLIYISFDVFLAINNATKHSDSVKAPLFTIYATYVIEITDFLLYGYR